MPTSERYVNYRKTIYGTVETWHTFTSLSQPRVLRECAIVVSQLTRRRCNVWQLQAYRASAALHTVLSAALCYWLFKAPTSTAEDT